MKHTDITNCDPRLLLKFIFARRGKIRIDLYERLIKLTNVFIIRFKSIVGIWCLESVSQTFLLRRLLSTATLGRRLEIWKNVYEFDDEVYLIGQSLFKTTMWKGRLNFV
jgi:hypothetical protein